MIKQRVYAIDDAKTPYVLLLDDDVEFEPQYVEKMFSTLEKAQAQCCIPILTNNTRPQSKFRDMINRFVGCEVKKRMGGDWYMKINRFGGYIKNTNLNFNKQYYSQTGHGSNCFAETAALRSIHFEDELWLESSGYALPDDQVMFYKIYLQGYKIAVCQNVYFNHLDAASTNDGTRYMKIAQAKAGNFLVFWYRFIYCRQSGLKKFFSPLFIAHRIFWESMLYIAKYHNRAVVVNCLKGLAFGLRFIEENKRKAE